MEESLALLIRSPTQRHPDLRLRAGPAWTVRRLKAELRRLVPEAPQEEDQKLIYAGRLLLDHQPLGELLLKHGELHALHLVYSLRPPASAQGSSAEVRAEQPQAPAGAAEGPSVPSLDGGRLRCPAGGQAAAGASSRLEAAEDPFQSVAPGSYTTYSMLQRAWLQQLYARQYYLQHLAAAPPARPAAPPRPAPPPTAPPRPGPDPAPGRNGRGAPPRLQEEEEEEAAPRDWLDRLYSATLCCVLLNLVCFHSSLSRLLLVTAGTALLYLHHVGWLPFRRRPLQPLPGHAAAPPAAANQDQNNNLQGGAAGRAAAAAGPAGARPAPPSPSLLGTACLFFKTFFASLLPEGPGLAGR